MKNIANNLNFSENLNAIHIAWQLMEKNASETSSTELDDDDRNVKRDISGIFLLSFVDFSLRKSSFSSFFKNIHVFLSINFQFPFISFAVKNSFPPYFAGVAFPEFA